MQKMVFDAHDRAFALFKGACAHEIYDTTKTAAETVFVGKDRLGNRRFLQMYSHYLVNPVACTPASGRVKGRVKNPAGLVREHFFLIPLSCVRYAARASHRTRFMTFESDSWQIYHSR
jgi:transposase